MIEKLINNFTYQNILLPRSNRNSLPFYNHENIFDEIADMLVVPPKFDFFWSKSILQNPEAKTLVSYF